MSGLDREIDPATGDYVSDGAGGTRKTRNATTALYHQFTTQLGSWWGDSEAGIDHERLDRLKIGNLTERELLDILKKPTKRLVAAGRISEPEIATTAEGNGVTGDVVARDLQSGADLPLLKLTPYNP